MRRFLQATAGLAALYLGVAIFWPAASYQEQKFERFQSFDSFYRQKLNSSRQKKARKANEELLLRFADKTQIAFLYVHGFGASRGEGELLLRNLARRFRANTYFLRLPGHGTSPAEHKKATHNQYISEVAQAIEHMPLIGHRIYIVASSMGAAISTYLSSRYQHSLAGMILLSPFYDFADPAAMVLALPGGLALVKLVLGSMRNLENNEGQNHLVEGWHGFWYARQYTDSLASLENIRQVVNAGEVFERVEVPVLMLYYYANEKEQDTVASVRAMQEAFSQFSPKHGLNRQVAIKRGNHVLGSEYVKTDKKKISTEISRFIKDVSGTNKKPAA